MMAGYDQWLEKPYDDACARGERFEAAKIECAKDLWERFKSHKEASQHIADYECHELFAGLLSAIARANMVGMTAEQKAGVFDELVVLVDKEIDSHAEYLTEKEDL